MNAKSMLVVDDVPEILQFFERVVALYRTRAVELVTTDRPADALELVGRRDFDVVISDYRMPGVDGLRVLTAARARHPEGRRVLITGYNEIPAPAQELADAGIDGRLRKPLAKGELLEFLQACLSDEPDALVAYRAPVGG